MSYFRLKEGDFPSYGRGFMVQYVSEYNSLVSYIDYVYFIDEEGNSIMIDYDLCDLCTEVGF